MAIRNILPEFNFLLRVWISCHLFIYDWSIICWCIAGRRMFTSLPVWTFDITGTWLYEDSTPAMTKNSNQDAKEEEHKRADDSSKNHLAAGWEHLFDISCKYYNGVNYNNIIREAPSLYYYIMRTLVRAIQETEGATYLFRGGLAIHYLMIHLHTCD